MDDINETAVSLYAAKSGIADLGVAAESLAIEEPSVRDHYRQLAQPSWQVRFVHADAYFKMGTAHETDGSPCQDYALAEASSALPLAILSDGCSLSGRTDVGARILSLSARKVLRTFESADRGGDVLQTFRLALLANASRSAVGLDLDFSDLDATLGVVQALPGDGARAFLFGDGVIAAKHETGLDISVVDWAGNMPGYPSYLMDPARLQVFIAQSEAIARRDNRAPFILERFRISPDGSSDRLGSDERGAADGLRGVCVQWSGGPSAPDVVAVASDGVFQVSGIAWQDVISEMMAIKAARSGAFVTRRMTRFLAQFAKRGGRPADDISMAALATEIPD